MERAGRLCRAVAGVAVMAALAVGHGAAAQDAEAAGTATGVPLSVGDNPSPAPQIVRSLILVFDRDRVIAASQAGRTLGEDIRARQTELLSENDTIAAELEARERALSEARDGMDEAEFRAAADAFDAEVVATRATQAQKAQALQSDYDTGLQEVEALMNVALTQVARAAGAVAVFEIGQVYLRADAIDITDEVIAVMDARDAVTDAVPVVPLDAPAAPGEPQEAGQAAPPDTTADQ